MVFRSAPKLRIWLFSSTILSQQGHLTGITCRPAYRSSQGEKPCSVSHWSQAYTQACGVLSIYSSMQLLSQTEKIRIAEAELRHVSDHRLLCENLI